MSRTFARLLCAVLASALLLGSTLANAANKNTVSAALHDCGNHDPLRGHYSIKVLQKALSELKTQSLQYTNCEDALQRAIDATVTGHPKANSNGGQPPQTGKVTRGTHKPTTNLAKQRVARLKKEGAGPVSIDGQTVTPGTVTVHSASFLSNLPTPLLIVLAALLATVLAVTGRAVHQFVRDRRPH